MSNRTAHPPRTATAVSPGKAILFGEHAINRGQPALSTAVGLYCTCRATRLDEPVIRFVSGGRSADVSIEQVAELGREVERWRASENFDSIRKLARDDYFGPQKYVLASMFSGREIPGLSLSWDSQVPAHSGLGSGGSAFTAMVAAVAFVADPAASVVDRSNWAHRGDVIAHGGVASALDSQTSLHGGVIRFTGTVPATQVPVAAGLQLVIADTGVVAATSEVNTRVRLWLAEKPDARMAYFRTIGAISRSAEAQLASGNYDELGRLMNLNQLVLEKIGVSCPQIDRLVEAAMAAGAFGAKTSGSGGGGIVIALVDDASRQPVIEAMTSAGGTTLMPCVAVPGTRVEVSP